MRVLIGTLLLLLAGLLQVTLVTRMSLLQGEADLMLLVMVAWLLQDGNKPDWRWGIPAGLMIGFISALPDWLFLGAYVAVAALCQLLYQRIWQVKLLTLFTATLLGTLSIHLITIGYLWLSAEPLNIMDAFNLITLPTMLLNLILVLPIFALVGELNKLISPNPETI
jgi:biotin transporter BioY